MLFHPNRRPGGREPDEIVRPSIVVAVAGKREQALRFDPFSMGAHYHIRPGLAEQIPLPIKEGQSPLDAAMASLRNRFGSEDFLRWRRETTWHRACAMRN